MEALSALVLGDALGSDHHREGKCMIRTLRIQTGQDKGVNLGKDGVWALQEYIDINANIHASC